LFKKHGEPAKENAGRVHFPQKRGAGTANNQDDKKKSKQKEHSINTEKTQITPSRGSKWKGKKVELLTPVGDNTNVLTMLPPRKKSESRSSIPKKGAHTKKWGPNFVGAKKKLTLIATNVREREERKLRTGQVEDRQSSGKNNTLHAPPTIGRGDMHNLGTQGTVKKTQGVCLAKHSRKGKDTEKVSQREQRKK